MSKHPQTAEGCIDSWIRWHTQKGTLPKTRKGYYQTASLIVKTFRELGCSDLPYKWAEKDVLAIRRFWIASGKSIKTQIGYDFVLRALAKHFRNLVPEQVPTRWPHDPRPNVKWLTLEQVRKILDTPMTELEEICIHLMLSMGLRRVEVIRAKLSDIVEEHGYRYLIVDGKGHKIRKVPFNWSTSFILSRWLARRAELVEIAQRKARRKNKKFTDSEHLIVYERDGRISPYSELHPNGFDAATVMAVSHRSKIFFTNHMLRRTFGRELYYKEDDPVDLVTLSEILGHDSVEQTQRYIGPDPRRMAEAILKTAY